MGDVAIRALGLSKQYRIGARERRQTTLRDQLAHGAVGFFRRNGRPAAGEDTIWALKDVSFDVTRGEVVGIIGRNGAGKSTLLRILSRITEPTEGRAEIYGRVGSLLEVGTGFHPELTGRENIYLNGAILGMTKTEINRKFDDIVAFAEIEKFIHTPVKHYSSGMYVRLAFAVAAHHEPEILLVDEVLAVGDAAFQKKCLGKMGDVAEEGRTVLFVSHNLQVISTLTKRTLLLDNGRSIFDGQTYAALAQYRHFWHSSEGEYLSPNASTGILRARVITSEPNQIHRFGHPLTFEFEIAFQRKPRSGAFSFQIVDHQMRPIVHLWLFDSDRPWSHAGTIRLRCLLSKPKLYLGQYSLVTHLSDRASQEKHETLEGICPFEIVMDAIPREYEWRPGTCTYLEEATWAVM